MPGEIILSVTEGPLAGRTFTFREHDTFIFGRAGDCHAHLSPEDTSASRHHFILEAASPQVRRCQRCHKDVATELTRGRVGDYVCKQCQGDAAGNPDVVRELAAEGRLPTPSRRLSARRDGRRLSRTTAGWGSARGVEGDVVAHWRLRERTAALPARDRQPPQPVSSAYRHAARSWLGWRRLLLRDGVLCGWHVRGPQTPAWGSSSPRRSRRIDAGGPRGVSYAHARGFVHRDLKPQNMLLADATPEIVKVSDFGLAKNLEQAGFSGFTATGGVVAGTFAFMAREQLIDFRFVKPVSDVWSAAATLYFLVAGYLPRDFGPGEDEMEVIFCGGAVPVRQRNPEIPVRLAEVIDRALADDLAHRFESAAAFSAALKGAL